MRRAVRALDPRVPASVRPPVAFVERDSVAARVGRPRRDGSLDDGARLLLVAPVDMAADEESSVHSLSVGADADDPSATPPARPRWSRLVGVVVPRERRESGRDGPLFRLL